MFDVSLISGKSKQVENEYVRFDALSALVIDDIGGMRHILRSQLQSLGMNSVSVARDAHEALKMIGLNAYDLIVCDYNLNHVSSGQHFLEYLRVEHLLKAKTVFVMVTAEAEYGHVASAVEFAPDDYILKPCPERKLRSRLERLFDRRTYLMPVLQALDDKLYPQAIRACDQLLAEQPRERWVLDVLRRKVEAQLVMNDSAVAATLAQAQEFRAGVSWVEIEIARQQGAQGDWPRAEEIAKTVLSVHRYYVPALELLAQISQQRKDDEAAYGYLKVASEILPGAVRLRAMSEAAMLMGKLDEAKACVQTAIRMSRDSLVEVADDYLRLAQTQVDMGEHAEAIQTLEKTAHRFGEAGLYGVSRNAVLAQAYWDAQERVKARKLLDRSVALLADRRDSSAMTTLGKAALKLGEHMLGLKLLTQAIQYSGAEVERFARHVTKAMTDTGHSDQIEDVIDGGKKRILSLVDEATRAMRTANFELAYEKLQAAFEIHDENVEALLAAAQLHLLWLKQGGLDEVIVARAKHYLATLDKLVPSHPKVMGFYKFFNELTGG